MNHELFWNNDAAWKIEKLENGALKLSRNPADLKNNPKIEASYYSCDYPLETFYHAAENAGMEMDETILTDGKTRWGWTEIDFDGWYAGETIYLNPLD